MAGIGLLQPQEPPPMGVHFNPSERELVDIHLRHRIVTNSIHPQCLIEDKDLLYTSHPDDIQHSDQIYFPPNQYYYFCTRTRLKKDRPVRIIPNNTDKWTYYGTKRILRGLLVIGHRETIVLKTAAGLKTGWKIHEYRLAVEDGTFQTRVLSHMIWDAAADERVHGGAAHGGFNAAEEGAAAQVHADGNLANEEAHGGAAHGGFNAAEEGAADQDQEEEAHVGAAQGGFNAAEEGAGAQDQEEEAQGGFNAAEEGAAAQVHDEEAHVGAAQGGFNAAEEGAAAQDQEEGAHGDGDLADLDWLADYEGAADLWLDLGL